MRYRLKNAISHIARAGTSSLIGIVGIGFITTLLATLLLNHFFILRQFEFKMHAPTLVAFLKDTVDESMGRTLVSRLEKNGQILAVNYASKAEKLASGETEFQDLGVLIKEAFSETRGVNPFPASLNVYVDEELITRKTLEHIALEIKAHDEIEDILLTGHGQLRDRLRDSERTTLVAIGVTLVVVWFIIGSVIKKTAIARTDEFHLMKLLGMFRRYLLAPFIVHGLFLGGLGALSGLGCFYGVLHIFRSQLGGLHFLTIYQIISVIVAEMLIGLIVGFATYRKFAS
ncbi:MAG: permease-like cell division protein FtsX [Candidatus Poribacteria bacterium]|nr:permease-like cell division protein FtsX [Candidatus Poribacteria bacterium]